MESKLLRAEDVARILDVSVGTLAVWRCRGIGPPYTTIGITSVRYFEDGLNEYLKGRENGGRATDSGENSGESGESA